MKNWRELLVSPNESIREAIRRIDSGRAQIVLVVDAGGRLAGTITDGDVRRGILKGRSLDDAAERVMNPSPLTAHVNESREALLRMMRQRQLHQIPLLDSTGRLAGLEVLDELLAPVERPNRVVIMAGGLGSRLRPLTDNTPKPMLRVGDKPILATIIETFAEYGFRDFCIAVNYKGQVVMDYFGDGSALGVKIQYLEEDRQLGTAGALALLKPGPQHPLLVMNGDILTRVNFQHLLEFHQANGAVATMCVRNHDYQIPYGLVSVDGDRLIAIDEKPRHRCLVSAGIYVLEPEALQWVDAGQRFDMPTLFERLIGSGKRTAAFPIREYWLDIGRMEDFEQAAGDFPREFL